MPGLDVTALFQARGDAHYGEAVTQRDHALQCATLASRAGSDDELTLAALLHDLAHLVTPEGRDTVDRHHGHIGAALVRPFVPLRVAWIIEHHVAAKRYLCAGTRSTSSGCRWRPCIHSPSRAVHSETRNGPRSPPTHGSPTR